MATTTHWKRDAMVTAATAALILLSLANGFSPWLVALTALLAPVIGYAAAGRLPDRSAACGCVALALGATLVRPAPGTPTPIADLLLLGLLAVAATTAGRFAERMAPARQPLAAPLATDGRWLTVVIECDEGPAELAGKAVRPKGSPRNDPERRRIVRVANDRVQGRRFIPRPKLQSTRS